MALSKSALTINIGTPSVSPGGNTQSSAVAIADTAVNVLVRVAGNNGGTPGAGDVIECRVLYSDDGTNYETRDKNPSVSFDTNDVNPGARAIAVNPGAKSIILDFENKSGVNTITVSASGVEQTNV